MNPRLFSLAWLLCLYFILMLMWKQAFTLVELIVVVTILAVLWTIGFVSYSGYLSSVRDTNRVASLTSIADGLELYRTNNRLPNPDDFININSGITTFARQWNLGKNVLETIEYNKAGKDPKDNRYYSYYLSKDRKYYQLMALLEEQYSLNTWTNLSVHSADIDYSNRYPKVYGDKLWILLDANKTPLQDVIVEKIDLQDVGSGAIISYLDDNLFVQGSDDELKDLVKVVEEWWKWWWIEDNKLVDSWWGNNDNTSTCLIPETPQFTDTDILKFWLTENIFLDATQLDDWVPLRYLYPQGTSTYTIFDSSALLITPPSGGRIIYARASGHSFNSTDNTNRYVDFVIPREKFKTEQSDAGTYVEGQYEIQIFVWNDMWAGNILPGIGSIIISTDQIDPCIE